MPVLPYFVDLMSVSIRIVQIGHYLVKVDVTKIVEIRDSGGTARAQVGWYDVPNWEHDMKPPLERHLQNLHEAAGPILGDLVSLQDHEFVL